ncbi:MAG: FAD-dependent oxidoreductase, partial [Aeromicrobium sp.]
MHFVTRVRRLAAFSLIATIAGCGSGPSAYAGHDVNRYKAVVIGAGPAGHTCAIRLAQLGARVAVVERDFVGGICTNWGCTPSKSMIESAKIARNVREAARYGINVTSFWV